MRKNSRIKAWASALLTAAMITTMGGMTAFADTDPISKVTLTKTVSASPSDIQAPNASFTFEVAPVTADTKVVDKGTTIVVYGNGPESGASFGNGANTITFTPGDPLSKTTDITLSSADFTKPGVYRYEITETAPTNGYDGMSYSTERFYLDLYVVNEGTGYKIEAVKIFKDGTEVSNKVDENGFIFTNTYATNNLSLTKKIEGNQADKNKRFEFKVTITGQTGEKFTTDYNNMVFDSGVTYTIDLGNNETINIYGLSKSDTYTIVETDYSSDGYTTAIAGADGTNGLTATGDVANGDDAVVYTNTKDVSTPTGIALTFAPYILMVAVAGVFAVLFLRKKREEF